MNAKITIITVCYNAEETVNITIRSVLEQTYPDIEYIVIDGASTDRTDEIVRSFGTAVDIYVSEADKGIYDAMNKGAALAQGDYLLFLNADDYLLSNHTIAAVMKKIKTATANDIVYGDVLYYDHSRAKGRVWGFGKFKGWKLRKKSLPHPATLISREFFLRMGSYDLSYTLVADYEFFVRALRSNARFLYIDSVISVFSSGGASTSEGRQALLEEERERLLASHFSRAKSLVYSARCLVKEKLGF